MNTRSFLSICAALAVTLFSPNALRAQDTAREAKTAAMLKGESLGGLRLGLGEKDVLKLLGKPEKQGKLILQAADGAYVQEWEYPSKGIEITMSAGEKKSGAKAVAAFSASPGSSLATKRGIKVGSPASEVRKAYASFENKEDGDAKCFVAGSIYGGILFHLERGKVSRIFFGAAAE
jgi:hypothetical protein